jgi:type VI secretion system protein ImpL
VAPPGTADTLAASTEAYVRALSALQISVDEVAKNANIDAAKAQVQTDATAALKALADVRNRFGMNADRLISDSSRKLLEDPIVNITRLLNDLEPVALNKKGKGLCDQAGALWRKYPFSANAAAQATIPEVNAIFRKPDGSLWKLYNESLQKALVKRENRYERTQETINPRFVEFFNRAAAFSEALYPEGAQEPRLTFSLKPVPTEGIQGTALNVNGQNLTYSGGTPAAKQFTWQGSSASVVSATVRFGNSADFEWSSDKGLWAIFQFFQKAERWQPAGEGHVVDWLMRAGIKNEPMRLHGNPLTVRYEIDKAGSFFQKGYFSTMGCIAEIAR